VAEYRALFTELIEKLIKRLIFTTSGMEISLGGYLQKLR
jgi:hypothetical protein